jgi:dihydrofolate reductase
MARIVGTEFVSLDMVMEDPGGSENFNHGGWSFEFERGEEGDKFKLDELIEADAQLLGRVTYEGFAAAWPKMEDDVGFAERMNTMPKYVFSNTLQEAGWDNTTILSGDFATEISKLKQDVDGNILVAGSRQLVQGLVEHDLLDELRLMIFPVILGSGKRIFGETEDKKRLKLADSSTVGAGVVVLTYEPA